MNEIATRVLAGSGEATRRRNPELFGLGKLPTNKPKQNQRGTLVEAKQAGEGSKRRLADCVRPIYRVALVYFRGPHALDSDNLAAGFKPLRDAIARSLCVDDSDNVIQWEYSQVETKGQMGTAARLERL